MSRTLAAPWPISANTARAAFSNAVRFSALFCSRRLDRSRWSLAIVVSFPMLNVPFQISSSKLCQLMTQAGHHVVHRPRRRLKGAAHADKAMNQRIEFAMDGLHAGGRQAIGIDMAFVAQRVEARGVDQGRRQA